MMELSVDLSGRGIRLEDRMGRTLYESDAQGEFWRYANHRGELGVFCWVQLFTHLTRQLGLFPECISTNFYIEIAYNETRGF